MYFKTGLKKNLPFQKKRFNSPRYATVGRGVRILCMDGGGIRGSATVQMLRRLEVGIGRPATHSFVHIRDCFFIAYPVHN